MPKVSVLMPVYNTSEEYLRPAIESILNQTFTDFEFVIINDGSTDNSPGVVREYAKKDKRIKFIDNKKNQGLIAVLNQGLDLCSGEYIARMDSDDIACSDRFAKQVAYMDTHPECGVLGGAVRTFGAVQKDIFYKQKVSYLDLIYKSPVAHPAVFLRKAILEKYGLRYNSDNFAAEDYGLWCDVIRYSEIHNIPNVILNYRVHQSSVSSVHSAKQRQTTEKIRNSLVAFLTDVPEFQKELYKMTKRIRFYDPANLSGHMLLHHPICYFRLRRKIKRLQNV